MGVLNVTPDSFSDGGLYGTPDAAVARGLQMVEDGADVIDVGGESSRPGAEPVSLDVEYAGRVKDPWGGERVGFSAKTAVSRKDFGLTWNLVLEAGGVTVGDKVEIAIEVEAVKAAAKAA